MKNLGKSLICIFGFCIAGHLNAQNSITVNLTGLVGDSLKNVCERYVRNVVETKTIPFIYFGVEDHQDYHKTTDTYENIDQKFYLASIRLVINATTAFDKNAEEIKTLSARP